jgi:NTE family protein
MRIGLALGSGGAATMAQIGVIEELVAAGVGFGCVAGSSGGALVGAALCAGRLDGLREAVCGLTRRQIVSLFDPTWPRVGMLEGRRGLEFVRPYLGEWIEALRPPFAAVALDLDSGLEVALRAGSVAEAVRASVAVPGILTPLAWNGRSLVDGGLVNPIPVSTARDLGASFVLAVNVLPLAEDVLRAVRRRSRNAVPLLSQLLNHFPAWVPGVEGAIEDAGAAGLSPSERRGLVDIVARAGHVAQCQIAGLRLQTDAPDFLLTVPVPHVGVFDFQRSTELIEAGRQAAREALPRLRAALARAEPLPRRLRRWLGARPNPRRIA